MAILYLLCIANILLGIKLRFWFLASSFYGLPPIAPSQTGKRFRGTEIRYDSIVSKGYYSYHVCFKEWQQSAGKSYNFIAIVVVVQVRLQQKDIETF